MALATNQEVIKMAKTKTPNFTNEQTQELVTAYTTTDNYDDGMAVIKEFAEKWDKTIPSIRQKLVREGVYRKKEYTTKQGGKPESKADLVARIAGAIGMAAEQADSLEKTNKAVLKALAAKLGA